ncbi:hypothetical protein [Streptomyces erythrochromogenes]|uniref:hypothetical protein n=1 Tax=Streptomyces erythrochromogenes TaxID=285574 RepID=UPI0036C57BB5
MERHELMRLLAGDDELEFLGLDRGVELLREHAQPVRTGKITAVDSPWSYRLFLSSAERSDRAHAGLMPAPGTTKGQVEEMSSDLALRASERATGIEPA